MEHGEGFSTLTPQTGYRLNFSPNSVIFQILDVAHRTGQKQLRDCPAKWLGVSRALVVSLYTLRMQEKSLLFSFKISIPLKTGFELHSLRSG